MTHRKGTARTCERRYGRIAIRHGAWCRDMRNRNRTAWEGTCRGLVGGVGGDRDDTLNGLK